MGDDDNNEDKEIIILRKEIEKYTKNIEHEKINLRLAKERYEKQYDYLIQLQNKGKPGVKPKQDNFQGQSNSSLKGNIEAVQRESQNKLSQIQSLIDEINATVEENKILKDNISELRKDKLNCSNLVESLNQRIDKSKKDFEYIYMKNKHDKKDPEGLVHKKLEEFEMKKKENEYEENDFVENRDDKEHKYHVSVIWIFVYNLNILGFY